MEKYQLYSAYVLYAPLFQIILWLFLVSISGTFTVLKVIHTIWLPYKSYLNPTPEKHSLWLVLSSYWFVNYPSFFINTIILDSKWAIDFLILKTFIFQIFNIQPPRLLTNLKNESFPNKTIYSSFRSE